MKAIAHGLSRAAIQKMRYGTGKGAFLSGFVSSGFSVGTKGYGGVGGRTAIMAIVGGTASEIGGGKFANGAMGSAFQYLFNDMMIGIHSNVSSKAGFTSGHSWISIYNDETGEFHTYGLFANRSGLASNGSGGVIRDYELNHSYMFVSNQFSSISDTQYDSISSMLVQGSDSWYVTHTCADYARDVYYKATGQYLDVDDYFGIETPRELAKSIGN